MTATPIHLAICPTCGVVFGIGEHSEDRPATCPLGHEYEPVRVVQWSEVRSRMMQVSLDKTPAEQVTLDGDAGDGNRRLNALVSNAKGVANSMKVICPLCGKASARRAELRRHLRRRHRGGEI